MVEKMIFEFAAAQISSMSTVTSPKASISLSSNGSGRRVGFLLKNGKIGFYGPDMNNQGIDMSACGSNDDNSLNAMDSAPTDVTTVTQFSCTHHEIDYGLPSVRVKSRAAYFS